MNCIVINENIEDLKSLVTKINVFPNLHLVGQFSNYIDELQVNFQPKLDSIIKDQQLADRIKQIINYNLSSINPTINK